MVFSMFSQNKKTLVFETSGFVLAVNLANPNAAKFKPSNLATSQNNKEHSPSFNTISKSW